MMRFLTALAAGGLAVSTTIGAVSAQNGVPINSDGSYVVASDDGVPIVSGAGSDINYGNIDTGGGGGYV
ncbi:MAG: hypothetical protein M3Q50_05540, partial [Chloroflexota bacterium]|nr:hypothetical protein [Chloroflexota bacterium]